MNKLFDLVNRAVSFGLINGNCYSAIRAVSAYELAQANDAARKERDELIRAIINILDTEHDHDRNTNRFDEFHIALSKAEELVDSIPHNIRRQSDLEFCPESPKLWQGLNKQEFDSLKSCGMLWELYPEAPTDFPE